MASRKKRKNRRKKQQKPKAPSVKVRKRLNILLITLPTTVILLIVVPVIGYLYLTAEHSMQAPGLDGLDVILGCDRSFSVTVPLSPHFDHGIISAAISINNPKEILKGCTDVTYIIPGISVNHNYLLPAKFPGDEGFDSAKGIRGKRKPIENVKRDPFGSDVVTVKLKQTPDFSGSIEFFWHGCLSRKSFSEFELLIPFGAVGRYGNKLNLSQSFRVSLPVPVEYRLVKHSVPLYGQRLLGNKAFYWFDIGKPNPLLHLVFENDSLKASKQRWQRLCIAGFGLGLSVLVAQLIALYNRYTHRDK